MPASLTNIASCRRHSRRVISSFPNGFTLLELLIVITIIAIGSAGVSFAFRNSQQSVLDRQADQLAAVLEAGRLQSRSTGVALAWVAHEFSALDTASAGYSIVPAASVRRLGEPQTAWQDSAIKAQGDAIILGPEPMLPAQSIQLILGERALKITSDGLRPFRVEAP